MAKYFKIAEDIEKMFFEVRDNTTIPPFVTFELRGNNAQKEIYVTKKLSELIEELTDGLNFLIIFNEEILIQLSDEDIKMVFEECLAGVTISESGNVGYNKPNFTTYSGVLQKFGDENVIRLKESIISLFDEKKQREDAEKVNKKKPKNQ